MKKVFFILCCLITFQAHATITCSVDMFGNRTCYGTNSDGEYVNTHSSTDMFGNTSTYGNIGNDNINIHSSTDMFGNTNYYDY